MLFAASCQRDGPPLKAPSTSPMLSPVASSTALARPDHPLSQLEARNYALALVNRDRASAGLGAVALDEIATAAAERHVADMAHRGFTAHFGSDGSVPDLRYTQAGGQDLVVENVACSKDGKEHVVEAGPFDPEEIERIEARFFDEKPPHDGHRKNILDPLHRRVGLSFAGGSDSKVVCAAQEFVRHHGTYEALPRVAKAGDVLSIGGELAAPFEFGAIGIARLDRPTPKAVSWLAASGGHSLPDPHVLFQTKEFEGQHPVTVVGRRFAIEVPLDSVALAGKKSGAYAVIVYGTTKDAAGRLDPLSARIVDVP